ncbi:MAG: hypothetical protein MJ252_23875 [archaeon]|nr:hypothetical protein [archaeon]
MSEITLIVFGTNQYYESPLDLIKNFVQSHRVENFSHKKESTMHFSYQLTPNDPTDIKLIFLRNFEKEYKVCQEADAYLIFIDLECVDALDKLASIITYIKENCSLEIPNFIIGKYNTEDDKIKSLDNESMQKHLKEQKILFNYVEICTEPKSSFEENIENILKKVQNDKFESRRELTKNRIYKGDDGFSESQCKVY